VSNNIAVDQLPPLPRYQWCHRCIKRGPRPRAVALVTVSGRFPELMCCRCFEKHKGEAVQVVALRARRRRPLSPAEVLAPTPTPALLRRMTPRKEKSGATE
jgi:hypothetical protein